MQIVIFSLFPEYFASPLQTSMLGRAVANKQIEIELVNIRDFAVDKHSVTDDRPFGGGPGMVLKVEPIDLALKAHSFLRQTPGSQIVLTSAKGPRFTQPMAKKLAELERLAIICGHYEGVDERVCEHLVDLEVRIGDFVMTGGEPAAAVIADCIARLQPGVLGNEASTENESHTSVGVVGFPQYTRPSAYNSWKVPEVLLSGDHASISHWREQQKKSVTD